MQPLQFGPEAPIFVGYLIFQAQESCKSSRSISMNNRVPGSPVIARFTFVLETERHGQPTKGQETSGVGGIDEEVLELRWKCEALAMLALLGFGAGALFAFLWVGKTFLW